MKKEFDYYELIKKNTWYEEIYYFFYRIYHMIIDIPRRIKNLVQRLTIGYSDEDIWNLKDTISEFIYPRLLAYKTTKRHSYPCNITPEEWENKLDKMLYSFYMINANNTEYKEFWDTSDNQYEIQEGLALFHDYYYDLWD